MSKELKGNSKKYALLEKIQKNIDLYNGQFCVYTVQGITVNDLVNLKKKLPSHLKLSLVPLKLALCALKDKIDVSKANLSGQTIIAWCKAPKSQDQDSASLLGTSVPSLLPKAMRSEMVFSGISWNNSLNTDKKLIEFIASNGIQSETDLKKRALFNIFKPLIQFKKLLEKRTQADNVI